MQHTGWEVFLPLNRVRSSLHPAVCVTRGMLTGGLLLLLMITHCPRATHRRAGCVFSITLGAAAANNQPKVTGAVPPPSCAPWQVQQPSTPTAVHHI